MRRQIKACFCPNPKCKKKLFRRKIKKNKPTKCNYCGYKILNPYEVFIPKSEYLKLKKNEEKN